MGVLDFFKKTFNRRKKDKFGAEVRSVIQNYYGGNYQYFVWNYANQIYNIPEVRSAIEKISDIFSSMPIYHRVTDKSGYSVYKEDPTIRVLTYKPNPAQNGTQFIKEAVTRLLLDNNVFIEPLFDYKSGALKNIYVIPSQYFRMELSSNLSNAYVQFLDAKNNPTNRYNLDDIIYISRFCSLFGSGENKLGLYETVLKSLAEQIVNVARPDKPRAILQSNQNGQGQLKEKDKKGTMETVRANFADNVQGLVYFDKMWTITPINWTENEVNQALMQLIINIVYNYFGINENIMNNKGTEIEMAMFVNTTIKPLALQFEKEFTNKLFTENEYYFGHRIEFDYQPLLTTTMASKTSLAQTGLRNGFFNIDEVREQFGYSPLPNGLGQVYRTSADLVNIEIVDDYELGKVGQTPEQVSTEENVSRETLDAEDINQQKEVNDGTSQQTQ